MSKELSGETDQSATVSYASTLEALKQTDEPIQPYLKHYPFTEFGN